MTDFRPWIPAGIAVAFLVFVYFAGYRTGERPMSEFWFFAVPLLLFVVFVGYTILKGWAAPIADTLELIQGVVVLGAIVLVALYVGFSWVTEHVHG
jgi:hypothetical protein